MSSRPLTARWMGRVPYGSTWELQQAMVQQRIEGAIGDTVLLLEHEPVITLGRGAARAHVIAPEALLAAEGIELFSTERGGDVTYHGPGQLVAYPIVDLKPDRCDVRSYVRSLSRVMSRIARSEGVASGHLSDFIGVWVNEQDPTMWPWEEHVESKDLGATHIAKIGAIGVKLTHWVTMHGFALNLTTNLEHYRHIVPCGIVEHPVTTLQALTGRALGVREAAERALDAFGAEWACDVRWEAQG